MAPTNRFPSSSRPRASTSAAEAGTETIVLIFVAVVSVALVVVQGAAFHYGLKVWMNLDAGESSAPDASLAGGSSASPAEPAATAAGAPIAEGAPRFDDWDKDQLPLIISPYGAAPENRSLLAGPVVALDGVRARQLDFTIPQRHKCAWSPDGKTLYAADEGGLLRIDAATWQVTHRLDLSVPTASINGVALTSEGVVVALRGVDQGGTGAPTADGRRRTLIDIRTGRPPETRSFRVLVVADPSNLQVVRQFIGPSRALAGAPTSPIVCVSDDLRRAKLVDLRTGKVLHQAAGGMDENNPDFSPAGGFDEFMMSPDGKTLVHTGRTQDVSATDVSAGKFGETRKLIPSVPLVSNVSFDQPLIYLSHDGQRLAVHVGDPTHEDGYSIIDVAGDGRDVEQPMIATRNTAFAFVGPRQRPVSNSNVMEGGVVLDGQTSDYTWTDYDLVLLAPYGEGAKMFQLSKSPSLEHTRMLGVPSADFVLVSSGSGPTMLVQLPQQAAKQAAEKKVVRTEVVFSGEEPEQPLRFVIGEDPETGNPQTLPTVHAPGGSSIAMSADGARLYLATPDGTVSAFDASGLAEVRRVTLKPRPEGERTRYLYPSLSSLLVEDGPTSSFARLNYDTLDAQTAIQLPEGPLATSAGSDFAVVVNWSKGQKTLEAYDVRDGRRTARFTPIQLAELEPAEAGDMYYQHAYARDPSFAPNSSWLACRYRFWHLFSVTDDGMTHEATHAAPEDTGPPLPASLHPIPEKNICFERGTTLKVLDFPSLEDTGRTVEIDERDEIVTFGSDGLIYCRRQESTEMRVYNIEGEVVLSGQAVEDKELAIRQAIVSQHRPDRIFVLVEGSLHSVDLASPGGE